MCSTIGRFETIYSMSASGLGVEIFAFDEEVLEDADEMVHELFEVRMPVVLHYRAQIERAHSRSSLNAKATATEGSIICVEHA